MDGKPVSVQPATSPVAVPPAQPVPTPSPKRLPKILVLLVLLIIVLFAAGGYYAGSTNFLQSQPVASPEVYASPQPIASTDPTAGWRTIERKNWSFKVPQGWKYLECSDTAIFVDPNHANDETKECNFEPSGTFWVTRSQEHIPPSDTTPPTGNEIYTVVSDRKNILINGKQAIYQHEDRFGSQGAGKYFVAYVTENNETTTFAYTDVTTENLFAQILSTFRFVEESVDTSGWKTYTDSVGVFQFKYPQDYLLDLNYVSPYLNRKISWRFENQSYADCRGDCPVVDSIENVTISGQNSTKIKGWTGEIGGNPAQSYIKYEIPTKKGKYFLITLQELPIMLTEDELNSYKNHKPQPIDSAEEEIFSQILSTFKFL